MVHIKIAPAGHVSLPSVEDMIADRLGQYAVASKTDRSRLAQAQMLFELAETLDMVYLRRRIIEEGGDPAAMGPPFCGAGARQ